MTRLDELTWPEAKDAAARGALVLLPVGSTEAHGPHLPLATDVILSDELSRRAAAALVARGREVLIAPPVAYAVTEFAAGFAGTVSIRPETAVALIGDVCRGLARQGFGRVCLVNSHLEPAHVETLRQVTRDLPSSVAFADQMERRWARTLTDEFKRGACHAGRYETSLLLAARPELVRAARAQLAPVPVDLAQAMRAGVRDFAAAGAPDAYFGDPAAATVAEGDAIYALLVAMVVATIDEKWP